MVTRHKLFRSAVLVAAVVATGVALAAWKQASLSSAAASLAHQPEPMESVVAAVARERQYTPTTTSIGTVLAMRSVTLRNELAGTVRKVVLTPGQIVSAGTVLVALDVSVEEAELRALRAQAELARLQYQRMARMNEQRAASVEELDNARAARDVALAQIARAEAIIARKTIRAPFRARIGISDVHPGQFLDEGTLLTTLQGIDEAANVDFTVAQQVAAGLKPGERVDVFAGTDAQPISAKIVAIDALVDPTTRNAKIRVRIDEAEAGPSPGASVRVRIPVADARTAVAVPASALRKGPAGDHVFVLVEDKEGKTRAHARPVQAGALLGDEVIVGSGLQAGEQVAISGSFKLRDEVLVAIIDGNAPPTARNER
jgi:membrane fusion protein (multidrug efflux system)